MWNKYLVLFFFFNKNPEKIPPSVQFRLFSDESLAYTDLMNALNMLKSYCSEIWRSVIILIKKFVVS